MRGDIKALVSTATSLGAKSDASLAENVRIGTTQENVVEKVNKINRNQDRFEQDLENLKHQIEAKEFCGDPQVYEGRQ
jgi:hypothetical protein